MGREGVDKPVVEGGVLPREVGEVGGLERLGGAVTGEPIGVGVVPIAVVGCERQLQMGQAVGDSERDGELCWAGGEGCGLV